MKKMFKSLVAILCTLAIAMTSSLSSLAYEDWMTELVEKCYLYGGYSAEETMKEFSMTTEDFSAALQDLISRGSYSEDQMVELVGKGVLDYLTPPEVKSNNISDFVLEGIEDKAYTGKAITLSIKITNGKTVLKNKTDYTVTYKSNKAIGKATVTIKGKGKYKGTITKTFYVVPKKITLSSAKANQKTDKVTLKWKKDNSSTGYQIYYSTIKDGEYDLLKTITKNSTITFTTKALKEGKTYYFKLRVYKTVSGKKIYGDYSAIKSAKLTSANGKETVDINDCDTSIDSPYIQMADEVDGNVHISWPNRFPSGCTGVQVLRSNTYGSEFDIIATVGKDEYDQYSNGYIDMGAAGKGYYYSLRYVVGKKVGTASYAMYAEPSRYKWYKNDSGYVKTVTDQGGFQFVQYTSTGIIAWNCDWPSTKLSGDERKLEWYTYGADGNSVEHSKTVDYVFGTPGEYYEAGQQFTYYVAVSNDTFTLMFTFYNDNYDFSLQEDTFNSIN